MSTEQMAQYAQPQPLNVIAWLPQERQQPEPSPVALRRHDFLDQLASIKSEQMPEQASALEYHYVFEDRSILIHFLKAQSAAANLLLEAVPHLSKIFGPRTVKSLRLVEDDTGDAALFGVVSWDRSAEEAVAALSDFDNGWWIENCHRADGLVNFDIELR